MHWGLHSVPLDQAGDILGQKYDERRHGSDSEEKKCTGQVLQLDLLQLPGRFLLRFEADVKIYRVFGAVYVRQQ